MESSPPESGGSVAAFAWMELKGFPESGLLGVAAARCLYFDIMKSDAFGA
jgi:hypothetical protein